MREFLRETLEVIDSLREQVRARLRALDAAEDSDMLDRIAKANRQVADGDLPAVDTDDFHQREAARLQQ